MSRQVTQGQAEEVSVYLTSDAITPAAALVYTDVAVEYSKNGGSFATKDLTPEAATITTGNSEPFVLADLQTLDIDYRNTTDGSIQTHNVIFGTGDFGDITNATASEVAAVLDALAGVNAVDSSGSVVLSTDTGGDITSVQITGGTANTGLAFPTGTDNGIDFFKEVGSGGYLVEFTAAEFDTLGNFFFTVNGSSIQQYAKNVVVVVSAPASTATTIETCILTGHVLDLQGDAVVSTAVSGEILSTPSLLGGVGISRTRTSTLTNSNGEFFLELARGAFVEVRIPKLNYKRQFTVPNSATANLFTEV